MKIQTSSSPENWKVIGLKPPFVVMPSYRCTKRVVMVIPK